MTTALPDRYKDERGMALVGVVLLLILASGVCAALAVSGRTETQAAQNLDTSAKAQVAAQAGLTAGIQAVITNLNTQVGLGLTASDAINVLLVGPDGDAAATADNGSLAPLGLAAPAVQTPLGGATDISYSVRMYDEDAWGERGMSAWPSATLTATQARIGENGVSTTDANAKVAVRAIGFGPGNTTVTVEAVVGLTTLPAIVTNGNLLISGNPTVAGQNGGVHSNANLTITSSATDIAKDATATGTAVIHAGASIGGVEGGGYSTKNVPAVNAIDYYSQADYVLNNDGKIYLRAGAGLGAMQCDASMSNVNCVATWGWRYDGGGNWSVNNNTLQNGSYYVKGTATVAGSPGTSASPKSITLIAEGSIAITGNPDFQPDAPELLFVTDGDLKIAGSLSTPIAIEGQVLVREQLSIHGTPEIAGQILVEDRYNLDNLVNADEIAGNPVITYNGIAGNGTFALGGWREVK